MAAGAVLIVGAGALGTALGYHLTLGGTRVTYLVRPARLATMPTSQTLYCYDDTTTKTFADYDVIGGTADVAALGFDVVVVTLDGAATRSVEGEALLRDLADAVRDGDTTMILCGVGFGLRDWAVAVTALPADRVMLGTLAYMCHEPAANLPQHSPTDAAALARADYAYGHVDDAGFTLSRTARAPATTFKEMFERSGVDRVVVASPDFYAVFTSVFFAFTLASELAGWPDAAGFADHPAELSLAVSAMREIAALPRFGRTGAKVRAALSQTLVTGMQTGMEAGLRPLDFTAFNRYHHGGKVLAQDVQVLRDAFADGAAHGHAMPALAELLAHYEAHISVI